MSTLLTDLRHAFRLLRKSWGFTFVAVTALSVSIGANTTIFGFVSGLLLRPLEVAEPDRLVRVDAGGTTLMPHLLESEYEEYRDRNQSFESLAMFHHGWVTPVGIDGESEMIAVTPVSGNYFETLGVLAAKGRTIAPSDDRPDAPSVVVLSHEGHRRYFDADPNVVGRTIHVRGEPYTVVGVTPPNFRGTVYPNLPQVYSTFRPTRVLKPDPPGVLLGRLKPGVRRSEAEADLSRIAAQLSDEQGRQKTIAVHPASAAAPQAVRLLAPLGALFMVIMAAVLWVSCCNIALLLLARAAARRREIGIRIAVGANRAQLLRQLLVESLVLASLGGVGAAFISNVTSRWLTQIYLPTPMPIAFVYDFDWRVLAFIVAISLAATLLFGVGPAVHSLRTDVVTSVKQGDHATAVVSSKTSFSLIVAQVAGCTAVLAMAGVMIRSVVAPRDPGFVADSVLMATVRLWDAPPRDSVGFVHEALTRLEGVSGVESVAAVDSVPLTNNQGPLTPVDLQVESGEGIDDEEPRPLVYSSRIAGDFFETLGIPLLRGRAFDDRDDLESTPVAIVNETLARRFWPGESPIGKFLRAADGPPVAVVGVAKDSKYGGREEEPLAFVYRPLMQEPHNTPTFLVKTAIPPESAATLVRKEIAAIGPEFVAYNLQGLEERLKPFDHIAVAWVSGVLGLLGLLLGAIGTYGLVAWSVYERRREIALRLALGGTRWSVVSLTTREGMIWAATGVVLGLGAFLIGAQFLRSFLRGVSPFDPVSFPVIGLLLLAVAYLACFVPAMRVSRADPLSALRE